MQQKHTLNPNNLLFIEFWKIKIYSFSKLNQSTKSTKLAWIHSATN
jgi:hypothetical protein